LRYLDRTFAWNFNGVKKWCYLTAPDVKPSINRLDEKANKMSRGTVAIAEPAINAPHSVSTGLCMLLSANGNVYISGERMTTNGPIKLFHEAMNVIRPSVPNAGCNKGRTIRA
jgi:hypothetical protein